MWETIHIIQNMGEWKPKYVIWEKRENVLNGYNKKNFEQYIAEMEKAGIYKQLSNIRRKGTLDCHRHRKRVFTVSVLNGEKVRLFRLNQNANERHISEFLLNNDEVPPVYDVTQPSVYSVIEKKA